ncbi:hypothetical protein DFR80_13622 [Halanaerobium sp. ST460_2HS_T2]|nr:hypothetical protein DFR80_13622 [Halanaerobium sp. ST460_2HS_T2]
MVGDDLPSEKLHFVQLMMELFWGFLFLYLFLYDIIEKEINKERISI